MGGALMVDVVEGDMVEEVWELEATTIIIESIV